ncbi:hypothetical protein ABVT39_010022 [Epinephelus coioides]
MSSVKSRLFVEYIDPPASSGGAQGAAPGGHCSGWAFALCKQRQGCPKNSDFPNLLYTALQLWIQVGGNSSLRGYRGIENLTVAAKPVIDAWITTYLTGQGQNPTADGAANLNIHTKHI